MSLVALVKGYKGLRIRKFAPKRRSLQIASAPGSRNLRLCFDTADKRHQEDPTIPCPYTAHTEHLDREEDAPHVKAWSIRGGS
jgi:hypothetical protein